MLRKYWMLRTVELKLTLLPTKTAISVVLTAAMLFVRETDQKETSNYHPNTHAKINGATMVASLSTMNLGVFTSSLPQVIFSFGTAPE